MCAFPRPRVARQSGRNPQTEFLVPRQSLVNHHSCDTLSVLGPRTHFSGNRVYQDLGVLRIEYLAAYKLLNGLYENASPY